MYSKLYAESQDLVFVESAGFSMWPFIRPGEKLVIKKSSIKELRIGDLVLYTIDSQLVCHRLLKKVKTKSDYLLYVRGDNSSGRLEVITQRMFLGKCINIIKRDGKVINLVGWKARFIQRLIAVIMPLVRIGIRIFWPYYASFVKPHKAIKAEARR